MKKSVSGLVLVVVGSFLVGCFLQRHALACEFLPVMDYEQVHPRVNGEIYVDAGMSPEQIDSVTAMVSLAVARIERIYGTPVSKLRMVVVSDEQKAASWGGNATASMHRMPWRTCIIIGTDGQNVDVMAHEWLHSEIQHRVGFWRMLKEIPTWFDEGVALTVDFREPFLPDNIDVSEADIQAVQSLNSARSFFSGNTRQHYQAARMAVQPLIQDKTFFQDLNRIASGESFKAVFLDAH